jgi:hypothetical protein
MSQGTFCVPRGALSLEATAAPFEFSAQSRFRVSNTSN